VTKKSYNLKLSEKKIINKFLKKLSLNTTGTFNFENDAGFLSHKKNNKLVVTTDTIVENIDFFSNDPPESIAQKIICVNLSDMSAMGAKAKSYTLNLSINSKINYNWIKKFTNTLYKLQKKYKIYLLGGDISSSKEISLTLTCFGEAKLNNIISQKDCKVGDDIWITGNLGNSYLGYKILTNSKIKLEKKYKNKFIDSYLYPKPCLFGSQAFKYINAATDISDGFYGDLQKILNNKHGAKIDLDSIPLSNILKRVMHQNNKLIKIKDILSWGDDYELIFTSYKKNRNKLINLANENNVKISLIGSIIKKTGTFDNFLEIIKNNDSFDHFS